MLNRLMTMFSESTLISGCLAIMIVGTACYLALASRVIPEAIAGMAFTIVAFFFGSKIGQQTERIRSLLRAQKEQEAKYNEWVQSSGQ